MSSILQYLQALPAILAAVVVVLGSLSAVCTSVALLARGVNLLAKSPKADAFADFMERIGVKFSRAKATTAEVEAKVEAKLPKPPVLPMLAIAVFALFLAGCAPNSPAAQSPERHIARGAVAVLAEVTQLADHECAVAAGAMKSAGNPAWSSVAQRCSTGYQHAKAGLYVAAAALDAWDSAAAGRLACASAAVLSGIETIMTELQSLGVKLSQYDQEKVDDAIKLGSLLARVAGGVSCSTLPPAPAIDAGADSEGGAL